MEKILQITSGRGPAECCWVVARVLKYILKEAAAMGISTTILHREEGDHAGTLVSAVVQLNGEKADKLAREWEGTIQWIGQSEFRRYHKRKNWFVGVNDITTGTKDIAPNEGDIRYETMKSRGPGGQNVNKVNTAVRAVHTPSGMSAVATESRSQHQNRKNARDRVLLKIKQKLLEERKQQFQDNWQQHNELQRGNPVKVFRGSDFKVRKEKVKYRQRRKTLKQRDLNDDEDF